MSAGVMKHPVMLGMLAFLLYLTPNLFGFGAALVQTLGIPSAVFTMAWDGIFIVVALVILSQYGFHTRQVSVKSPFWLAALAALIVTAVIGNLMATVVYSLSADPLYAAYAERGAQAPSVVSYVLSLVIAPLAEELVMRGLLYGGLRMKVSVGVAAACSSIAFAFSHGTLTHLPLTLLLGLVSCAVYERSRCIWLSVLCHMAINFSSSFIIPHITVPVWMFSPVVAGGLWLLSAVGCVALLIASKRSVGPWYDDEMTESTQVA